MRTYKGVLYVVTTSCVRNIGIGKECGVSFTPQPLGHRGEEPEIVRQEAGLAPEPVLKLWRLLEI